MPKERSNLVVRTWKASPEYVNLLKVLESAKVERSESARVRAGLKALAEKHGVKVS